MSKKPILLHQNELDTIGIGIVPIETVTHDEQLPLHRDDHYMFII